MNLFQLQGDNPTIWLFSSHTVFANNLAKNLATLKINLWPSHKTSKPTLGMGTPVYPKNTITWVKND